MAKKKSKKSKSRKLALKSSVIILVILTVWAIAGEWYVHHPRKWLAQKHAQWPKLVTAPLCWMGNPVSDITDGLGWTGHDAVYEYDTEAPEGEVFFAGAPRRVGAPAPTDVTILDRGHFKIGWSNSLKHPLWCAYHVKRDATYEPAKRPNFAKDPAVSAAPRPDDYTKSGYDRGHMAPNFAIASRYGDEFQRLTFLMSNIAPQSPALNRGVWRDLEHRIAELWTARYGEIWVVVGCIPSPTGAKIPGKGIDIPSNFYQVIIAQEGLNVRAMAMTFPQNIPWSAWAARNLITIDELEERTGLDFNPDLPQFIQDPLESELPSRLWPIRPWDIFKQILFRFQY